MMKNYLLQLLSLCSEEQFGQDAVEWAIVNGHVKLTYQLEADLRTIMGEPGHPETGQYDTICENWRRTCQDREAPDQALLEELNRPAPIQLGLAKAA